MQRNESIDIARGFAIVLVAVFHMVGGLVASGKLPETYSVAFAGTYAYSFHVQIFFFVSGYFLEGRMKTWGEFWPRAVNLYYPYIVWSLISAAAALAFAGAVNNAPDLASYAAIPVRPILHYWFLLDLILAMAVYLAVRKHLMIAFGVLLAINISLMFAGEPWKNAFSVIAYAYWFAWFILGALVRRRGWMPPVNLTGFLIALPVSLAGTWAAMEADIYIRQGIFFVPALCACYALYCISALVERSAAGRPMAVLGRLSLVVYLTHVLFGTAIRMAAYRLWPAADAYLVMIVGSVVSVGGPLVLYAVAVRLKLARIAGFTPLLSNRPKPATAAIKASGIIGERPAATSTFREAG
jgi:fucose 4-O-acetylase-like acetyltransferase